MCSLDKYFLSTYYVPIPVLGVGYIVMKSIDRILAPKKLMVRGSSWHELEERSREGGVNES